MYDMIEYNGQFSIKFHVPICICKVKVLMVKHKSGSKSVDL